MEIGLYKLKYPFRRLIQFLLPIFRNTNPNTISLYIVPIGILTAADYWIAKDCPWALLLGIVLIFIRMIVATLDGLVAVTYGKSSTLGEIINRIAPEFADFFLMASLAFSRPDRLDIGLLAILVAWATTFSGLIGLTGKRPVQSVGPVGQTDRLATLMLFSFLQYLSIRMSWGVDFIKLFLEWTILGGCLTVLNRITRTMKAAETP